MAAAFLVAAAGAGAAPGAGLVSAAQGAADNWERYTFRGEEFSVELPGAPFVWETGRSIYRSNTESDRMRVFGVYAEGAVYLVASFDNPRPSEPLDYFASYIWGRALTARGDLTAGGFQGREYAPPHTNGAVRLFRAAKHAYLFAALTEEAPGAAARRFFDSVTLSARPAGRAARPLGPPVIQAEPLPTPPRGGEGAGAGGSGGRAQAPAEPAAPYRAAEVTRKAVLLYRPEPHYTEGARRDNVTGVVRLRAVLSSSGKVERIGVVKTLPEGLTEQAVRAARHILFFPAVKEGRRVSQWVVIEYNFNIY